MKSILSFFVFFAAITSDVLFIRPGIIKDAKTESLLPEAQHTIAVINGQVFNGKSFERKDIYSSNGVLSFKMPSKLDTIIDVTDKYIIPPFGEAHNHNLGDSQKLKREIICI